MQAHLALFEEVEPPRGRLLFAHDPCTIRLTERQRTIYQYLAETEDAERRTVAVIAEQLSLSKPLVSKAIKKFVRTRLARRLLCPIDHRTFYVFLNADRIIN